MSSPNILTKDGLTGNSGLGVDNLAGVLFHIASNYSAGKRRAGQPVCFVEWTERGERVPTWKRMTVKRARREKRRIITCARCEKPAISLDHYWPYDSSMNYCATHRKAVRTQWSKNKTSK